MKLRVKNLGMIRDTEIDIRPLTVIIGPNNTSKTYLAYSIYGIWKAMQSQVEMTHRISAPTPKEVRFDDDSVTVILDDQLQEELSIWVKRSTDLFRKSLDQFFQDPSGYLFRKTSFSVDLSHEFADNPTVSLHRTIDTTLPVEQWRTYAGVLGNVALETKWIDVYFPRPILLPAERNAFILTYKMLGTRRYRILRDGRRKRDALRSELSPAAQRQLDLLREQGDIRYPEPIEDFLDFLSDIELGPEPDSKDPDRKAFGLLADKIETHLHGGQKLRFQSTRLSGRELKLDIDKHLSIDLYNASSSIKQITPLLLYLRFRAKPGDFLIIDEPEMNLHPETQARLLEVLAMLVNAGIRILLTTHSPYFMDHLNNLVAGDHSRPAVLKKQAKHLYIQDTQAFLKMDQVSAYVMDGGDLRSLKDPDYGIRWDTLSNVSGDIQQKYFAIRKAEQSSRGKTKA